MAEPPAALAVVRSERSKSDTPLAARDDDELMLLARGGNDAAFDELVRRYQPRVVRIAARYLGDPASAADVAQATLLELHRALPHYRPKGRFSSYLYRVLINQCHMARRARRSQERAFSAFSTVAAPNVDRPDDWILARERTREVERALGQLSTKLRDVLVLRFAGELSYEQIAATLQLPLGTVKRRIFDGIGKLHVLMEGER
jgi:RNA polymerase sigma-70 factor (ECF subfamily)